MEILSVFILIFLDMFGLSSSLCELRSVSLQDYTNKPASHSSPPDSNPANQTTVIHQCSGTCHNSLCAPRRTRIAKVELAVLLDNPNFGVGGGMFPLHRERRKRRRKSLPRQRQSLDLVHVLLPSASRLAAQGSPLILEVVDHLDCFCAFQVLNQVKSSEEQVKDTSANLPSLTTPSQAKSNPKATSIQSTYSSNKVSSEENAEYYRTCMACKEQAELCEESDTS